MLVPDHQQLTFLKGIQLQKFLCVRKLSAEGQNLIFEFINLAHLFSMFLILIRKLVLAAGANHRYDDLKKLMPCTGGFEPSKTPAIQKEEWLRSHHTEVLKYGGKCNFPPLPDSELFYSC